MPRLLRVGLLIHVCSSISQVELDICSLLALALQSDDPLSPRVPLGVSCSISSCSFVSWCGRNPAVLMPS